MTSNVFKEDIKIIVSCLEIPWNEMRNSTVLVTGATGLIGKVLVHTLSAANKKYELKLRIIAHGRSSAKGEALTRECDAEFVSGDIREPFQASIIARNVDYIFHCAAITSSADMVAKPVDVMFTAVDGTRNVLELARQKQAKSVVYLSSMEVYGQTDVPTVNESDLGYIDLAKPRSSYPESKRFCENLCVCYYTQYGVPVKIARLARVFGAGAPNDNSENRVPAQFARKAIACEDIILHTEGNSMSNCCYTADVVSGLLLLLLKGENGEVYNFANKTASASIRDMAELVADKLCGGKVSVIVDVPPDIEKRGYAPDTGFRMNAEKLMKLGWTPKYGLERMYQRMIADWKET